MFSETSSINSVGVGKPEKQDGIHDPRVRRLQSAPPPPRISSTFVKPIFNDGGCGSSSNPVHRQSTAVLTKSEKVSSSAGKNQVAVVLLNTSSSSTERSRSPPPYDDNNKDTQMSKNKSASQNAADVIENVSMFLKTKDNELVKCKKNFLELRKCYDAKKVELAVARKHFEDEKKDLQEQIKQDRAKFEEELQKVKAELKTLTEENEKKSIQEVTMQSNLQHTLAEIDRQKILTDMHASKVSALEKENSELQQIGVSQSIRIGGMADKIFVLEAAFREDVSDKKKMFEALKHYMGSTQNRIKDLVEKTPGLFELPVPDGGSGSISSSSFATTIIKIEAGGHWNDDGLVSSNRDATDSSLHPKSPKLANGKAPPEETTGNKEADRKRKDMENAYDDSDSGSSEIIEISPPHEIVWKQKNDKKKKHRHD